MTPEESQKWINTVNDMMWKLDENKHPVKCSPVEFEMFLRSPSKIIKQDYVRELFVSTVFLGVNMGLFEDNPQWFETMIFENGCDSEVYVKRYSTWHDAYQGHKNAVSRAERLIKRRNRENERKAKSGKDKVLLPSP